MTAPNGPVPPLRDWAFAVYGRPGVEAACLELQDDHAMDVVALLWCIWAGRHLGAVDAETMERALAETGGWQAEIVAPLRSVRRLLRTAGGEDTAGGEATAGSEDTAADRDVAARDRLRRQVADAELAAEEIQLARLDALTGDAVVSPILGPPGAVAVRLNLERLVAACGSDPDPDRDEVIAALVRRVGGADR